MRDWSGGNFIGSFRSVEYLQFLLTWVKSRLEPLPVSSVPYLNEQNFKIGFSWKCLVCCVIFFSILARLKPGISQLKGLDILEDQACVTSIEKEDEHVLCQRSKIRFFSCWRWTCQHAIIRSKVSFYSHCMRCHKHGNIGNTYSIFRIFIWSFLYSK